MKASTGEEAARQKGGGISDFIPLVDQCKLFQPRIHMPIHSRKLWGSNHEISSWGGEVKRGGSYHLLADCLENMGVSTGPQRPVAGITQF
jgi:hypothetical protein